MKYMEGWKKHEMARRNLYIKGGIIDWRSLSSERTIHTSFNAVPRDSLNNEASKEVINHLDRLTSDAKEQVLFLILRSDPPSPVRLSSFFRCREYHDMGKIHDGAVKNSNRSRLMDSLVVEENCHLGTTVQVSTVRHSILAEVPIILTWGFTIAPIEEDEEVEGRIGTEEGH